MLPKTADVVIIGSGAMGLSTAYHLALNGYSNIVVLERDSYPGGHSTSRCAGGFRHQFATEINILLSKLSNEMFLRYRDEMDCKAVLNSCGYMFVLTGNDNVEAFKSAMTIQHRLGIETQWITVEDIREKIPRVSLEDVVAATYYQMDGLIDVGNVMNAHISAVNRLGIKLLVDTSVLDIGVRNGRIDHVITSKGNISTPIVVNAAGARSAQICRMMQIDLPVKPVQQQLFVTSELPWVSEDFPVVIFPAEGIGFHKEGKGLLSGLHKPEVENESLNLSVDTDWEMVHCEKLIERIPSIEDSKIISSWAGFYEMTPDLHPIIGRMPWIEGLFCITGFSGHGFMHSPACGLLVSEEIIYGKAKTLDITSLRIERFHNAGEKTTEFYKI
ncbi:MAG TPA: FAD-binding oxidoreductase [Pseudobacteroides sp.]|uniref:NAD(P)/FAD-dependent oxidoreductase n=1 Tax=Pseudobacteroides sp. TaxID=1968840 RepID=UPI002F9218CD